MIDDFFGLCFLLLNYLYRYLNMFRTPFHADVLRSYSWSANVCGRKKWIIYPRGTYFSTCIAQYFNISELALVFYCRQQLIFYAKLPIMPDCKVPKRAYEMGTDSCRSMSWLMHRKVRKMLEICTITGNDLKSFRTPES